LEFESEEEGMAELIVRVTTVNEESGRQIMEVLFQRQEARDQGVYEALCAAEGSG
jgi:transcription initiation factor IIE alpha subunit